MGAYFDKYKKYYDALQGKNLKGPADSLSSSISTGITSAKNKFNQISGSKWNEQAKVFVNLIISSIQNNLAKLNDFVSFNLVNACSLAEQLYKKVEEIKKSDELLENLKKELENLKNRLANTSSTIPDGIDENGEPKTKNNPEYTNLKNQVNNKMIEITSQINHLEDLCDAADQLISQIQALNGNGLSTNISISDFSSKGLAEYLSNLSAEELENFLSTYQGELILEGSLDLAKQFNLKEIIDDMPTIRYDIKAIYDLLEGNEYRSLMIDYLIQYANGDVDIKSFYEKYPDLLPWNSTKGEPIYLFDYYAQHNSYKKNESLASALNIVLDHTIASTMLPYYQNGTLTTHKAVQCNSLVLASNFLVRFSYTKSDADLAQYMWKTDTSSIIGIGGGHCHHFANGVLFRSMALFSTVKVIKDPETNGVISRVLHNDVPPSPYAMLFDGQYKVPGSEAISKLFKKNTTEEFTPGTVAANFEQVTHVIIYLGKGTDYNGNTVYIIADSTKHNNTGEGGVSIRILDGSSPKNTLGTYKFKITESDISSLDNYSDTAINYGDYAEKYGVSIN